MASFPFFFHKLFGLWSTKAWKLPCTRPVFPPRVLGFIAFSIYGESQLETKAHAHTYTHTHGEDRGLEMLIQTHRRGV